ncbi:hypothetical protein FPV67DRAFT_1673739 [Lyophyllum atratum]|nr:hypothetical protein FPV67DRAFT_1673739 [Lyophyllum atratum]
MPSNGLWYCNCQRYCSGLTVSVSRTTFYDHKPYRNPLLAISPALLEAHQSNTTLFLYLLQLIKTSEHEFLMTNTPGERRIEQESEDFGIGFGSFNVRQGPTDAPPCALLGLLYAEELGVIVCKSLSGGCLIPADRLLNHLKDHHSKDLKFGLRKRSLQEWTRIADHILTGHGINPEQSSESLSLPTSLTKALEVEGGNDKTSTIAIFYKCPYNGCKNWSIYADSAQSTQYNVRPTVSRSFNCFLPEENSYPPFGLSYQQRQSPEPRSTLHHAPPTYTGLPETPIDDRTIQATWMIDFGWVSYLDSLGEDMSVDALKALAAPLGSSKLPKDSPFLEIGLRLVDKESRLYFMNTNEFLSSRHSEVRAAVPAGSAKSRFRDICPGTSEKYRRALMATIIFMTHFLQKKEDRSTHGLRSFKIEGHPEQVKAADSLRKLILHKEGNPDIGELRPLMHRTFVALLCPLELGTSKVTCPIDQALLLLALVGPGLFIRASALMYHSAGLQYTFRCVLIHIARLASVGAQSYQPWVLEGQIPDQDEAEDGALGLMEGDNIDVDAEALEDSDSGYEGTDSELPADQGQSGAELPKFSKKVTE